MREGEEEENERKIEAEKKNSFTVMSIYSMAQEKLASCNVQLQSIQHQ